jgi:hypothetical protein
MRLLLIFALTLALAGCGLFQPMGSWVELTSDADCGPLSDAIVVFVAQSVPTAGATIAIAELPAEQGGSRLSVEVREKLISRGYRPEVGDEGVNRLRYLVTRYGERILLRVTVNDTEASVLFARDSAGTLRADTPLTMRQKGKFR